MCVCVGETEGERRGMDEGRGEECNKLKENVSS